MCLSQCETNYTYMQQKYISLLFGFICLFPQKFLAQAVFGLDVKVLVEGYWSGFCEKASEAAPMSN